MSSLLSAELSATCNALGAFDKITGKYLVDEYSLNTVKDLIRFLRRDGEDHEIRRHLGCTKVLQNDLVPLLIDHWQNEELFDVTLRLLVNLTNPALLLYHEDVPVERTAHHNYLELLSHQQSYKSEAFIKSDLWDVFAKKLTKVLEIDWSERDEDTGLIIERILILIRNVLHVPADKLKENKSENDASVHDQVLWALHQSRILDIILYMASENEKQYFMHILEIITHLLREQNPGSLADAALQRSVEEKLKDERELLSIRSNETKQKNDKVRQYSSSRHSRFGGTYVIQNMKSISDNHLLSFKPLTTMSALEFGCGKKQRMKRPKNKRPIEIDNLERRSAFAIRLCLKEFCIEFLNGSYNPLMHYVKDVLVRAKAQQNDESYYLWTMKFFMEFNRRHQFNVGLVSETMSVPMFHFVQQQMEKHFDMIKVEKKKFAVWVKRLHLALKAYKELLNTLSAMDSSPDGTVRESAKVIKSNVFYVVEYREFILSTFLSYDENKMPRGYLVDLLETTHLFLKMLEHFCKKTGLVVQKRVKNKGKKRGKPNKSVKKPTTNVPVEPPHWEEVSSHIAAVLAEAAGVMEYPPPFDAASDVPIDEQRGDCMKKIQKSMMEKKYGEAVGIFRAARDVWPEEGIFGVSGMPEGEELAMLETIYVADLGVELTDNPDHDTADQENLSSDDYEEEEEDERGSSHIQETEFKFSDFAGRFCHPRVVSACAYLLEGFEQNSEHTNHCIVKMLHRIAWDFKFHPLMFQASLFLVFQKILRNANPQFKELQKFAIFIIRKFVEMAEKNPKIYIELLFWKYTRDSNEIENGYDGFDNPTAAKVSWTEEEEEELRTLYLENQKNPATDQDVIDWILENLISRERSRRSVIRKLKDMGLIFKAPTKKSNVRPKVPITFTEDEDDVLATLWQEYKDTVDPMMMIACRMPYKRPKKRLVERLMDLNIIKDRKEARKKRSKNRSNAAEDSADNSVSSEASGTESEEDSDRSRSNSPAPTLQKKVKAKQTKASDKPRRKSTKSVKANVMSASEVAKLLVKAVNDGLTEALKWLAECIEEVALDQEAEGFDPTSDGVPLVPITSDAITAMEDRTFRAVLEGVGLKPPEDEQETYWRIPSSITFDNLRKRREVILKAIDKSLLIDDDNNSNVNLSIDSRRNSHDEQNKSDDNSSDEDLFDNLRKIAHNDGDGVAETYNRMKKKFFKSQSGSKSKKHTRIRLEVSSDDDDATNFAKRALNVSDENQNNSESDDILIEARKNSKFTRIDNKRNNKHSSDNSHDSDSSGHGSSNDGSDSSDNENIVSRKKIQNGSAADNVKNQKKVETRTKIGDNSPANINIQNSDNSPSPRVDMDNEENNSLPNNNSSNDLSLNSMACGEASENNAYGNRKTGFEKNHRKRSLTSKSDTQSRKKLKRIQEEDTNDSEDILEFAKKALENDSMPDTEDILSYSIAEKNDTTELRDDSDEEIAVTKKKTRRVAIIDDDSD